PASPVDPGPTSDASTIAGGAPRTRVDGSHRETGKVSDMRGRIAAYVALVAVASSGGCDTGGTPCYPGDAIRCACAGGKSGLAVCAANGGGYGACSCEDAGVIEGGATLAPADAGLPFGAACATDTDCASGVCFTGGMRAFCSLKCKGPQD